MAVVHPTSVAFETPIRLRNVRSRRKIAWMDKWLVLEKLRYHECELKAAGIVHLRVFGSVARDEASSKSDVDLLADFDQASHLTLVKVGSLQSRLSKILDARVDLSSPEWMLEPIRSEALREALIAF